MTCRRDRAERLAAALIRLDSVWVTAREVGLSGPALHALERVGLAVRREQDEGGTDGIPTREWASSDLGDQLADAYRDRDIEWAELVDRLRRAVAGE